MSSIALAAEDPVQANAPRNNVSLHKHTHTHHTQADMPDTHTSHQSGSHSPYIYMYTRGMDNFDGGGGHKKSEVQSERALLLTSAN
jgi:hypothetical protein